MQLLVLVFALLVLGVPGRASAGGEAIAVARTERTATDPRSEAPHRMLELPTRALATSAPRTAPDVAVMPVPLSLPPATSDRMSPVRLVATEFAESAPRSSRAPPAA